MTIPPPPASMSKVTITTAPLATVVSVATQTTPVDHLVKGYNGSSEVGAHYRYGGHGNIVARYNNGSSKSLTDYDNVDYGKCVAGYSNVGY